MSSNGTTPHSTVTEVIRCRVCDTVRSIPPNRTGSWEFVCNGCGSVLEIDLGRRGE